MILILVFRPKVAIIGSREQLCIHPEVAKRETNAEKVSAYMRQEMLYLLQYCMPYVCSAQWGHPTVE